MNSSDKTQPVKVLTIAGSDSGGAAGLQADLKTFTTLQVYGMSVVTAVTAQNSVAVTDIHYLPDDFVAAQMEAVLSDYGAAAVKTGFTGRPGLVSTIGRKLADYRQDHLIVDPVLVNHRGEAMFPAEVTRAYVDHLLPQAELITPNREEAALLSGLEIASLAGLEAAAREIHNLGARNVLVKGIRIEQEAVDLLFDGRSIRYLRYPWIHTANIHGSGDTLSAAICAYLARGLSLGEAVRQARDFTHQAIRAAAGWRLGQGHGPVSYW